jgi:hypothetical protein
MASAHALFERSRTVRSAKCVANPWHLTKEQFIVTTLKGQPTQGRISQTDINSGNSQDTPWQTLTSPPH